MDGKSIMEVVLEAARNTSVRKVTLRQIEKLALTELPVYSAEEIKAIREKTHTSQAAFARVLNVKPTSIQKWEAGEARPVGAAMKLLHLVDRKGLDSIAQ